MTIYDLIQSQADRRPDSAFLMTPEKRDFLTFSDLRRLVLEFGYLLHGMGVSSSDRIVTVLPNGPESAAAFLAVTSFSACAPLNPNYSAEQFAFYLKDLNPAAVVLPAGSESPVRQVATDLGLPIVEIRSSETAGRFEVSAVHATNFALPRPEPGDVALLLHTSGTTARPKLVPIPHSNLVASAQNIAATLALTESDRALNIMPLFHIHGLVGVLLSSLSAGAQVVCTPGMDPAKFNAWLRDSEATWYSGVPTMHSAILSSVSGETHVPDTQLRFIRSSSASLPVSTLHALESTFGVPVVESYGMTEAAHQMASNPLPPAVRKPGSVGLPSGPEVLIRHEDGIVAPTGEVAEVLVKGETIVSSYEHGRSPESFVNGWFRTGDLGYLDEDRYLFLTGRIKEMVNRGGEKVAPAAVESVLLEHPAVAEAVVFGAPHPTLGEDVVAALVLTEADEPVGPAPSSGDMRAYALSKLSEAQVPGQFVFVPSIPKGPTGKVQRSKMFEQLGDRLQASYEAPSGRIARLLLQIWGEVLDVQSIGAQDNFFALGGDSLSGARVAARVRHVFQIEFDIVGLFTDPVLQGMAACIELALIEKIKNA